MTTYTRTGSQVFAAATDFAAPNTPADQLVAITPDDVVQVTAIIYDTDKVTPLLESTPMTWSAEREGWLYVWDPGDTPSGTYEVEVTVDFLTGPPAVGYSKVHIKRRPAGA